jgi:alpha-galactosidase
MCARLVSVILLSVGLFGSHGFAGEKPPQRVLFVGNSITRHGPSAKIGWAGDWGMAASALGKDYVHLVVEALTKRNGQAPEFLAVNVAAFERDYAKYDLAANLQEAIAFRPDTIVLAIGENVPALANEEAKTTFTASVVRLLKLLERDAPARLFVRSCFWANPAKDAALREACTAAGGEFVNIEALGKDEKNFARSERKFEHAGVANHPGDRGMQAIANALVEAMNIAKR